MAQERLPRCLGRYEVLEQIGAGGMGVVLRAFDPKLGRDVAVKLLTASLGAEPEFAERFRREATALARLTHPNVVCVYDAGEQDGRPFYVMELLSGRRLDERTGDPSDPWTPAKGFNAKEFLEIFTPLAEALCAVHAEGVLHRDIKPANVMLGVPERGAVLTDFGLAAIEGAPGLTLEGEILGTSRYISPEQLKGSKATPASDVYGLGLCMYEYATARVPFADIPVSVLLPARVHAELAPVARLATAVPGAIAALIDRAVKNSPTERFATAEALHKALVRVRREGLDKPIHGTAAIRASSSLPDTGPLGPSPAALRRRRWLLAGLACGAAALAWRWQPSPPPTPQPPTPTRSPVAAPLHDARPPAPSLPPVQVEQPVELGDPSMGPSCGYAGPAIAHTGGRLLIVWVCQDGRVLARLSADGGRTWIRAPLDGKLRARVSMSFSLTGIDGRFFLLYSTGTSPSNDDSHSPIQAAWTSADATAWSSPTLLGEARDRSEGCIVSGRMADGRARALAVWQAPEPRGEEVASCTTAWCDTAKGTWSAAERHPMQGTSFDDPVALLTPTEGLVTGRLRRLVFGNLIAMRSRGPGAPWSPPASGHVPGNSLDRKQPAGFVDRDHAYLVFRKPADDDAISQVVAMSHDGFRTLEYERILPQPPSGARKSCRIAAKDNRLWAIWEGIKPTPEYWSTSKDNGLHWTVPKRFAYFYCWHPAPAIDVDDTGRAWICWADGDPRVWAMALP